ncbi:MAG: hypothetical protein M3Z46_11360 [Actinomycetota bacterium]|nr:hypothetical protein [Actinomycetota bacterium]
MQLGLFEEVADALRGLVPVELGDLRARARRYGIKVWFGAVTPPREHYEAQVIGPRHVEGATVLGLEVGFHAEHQRPAENDAVIAHLLHEEGRWREALGGEATAGLFLGGADGWRRISEAWPDPDLGDADLGFEVAARLVDYVTALEVIRRGRLSGEGRR